MTTIAITSEQANIELVHSLVEAGKSRRAIIAETGLKERFVKTHMKGAVKGAAIVKAPKITRPNKLNQAAEQAYVLAIRPQGCKDYELRAIAKDVYGTKRDEERGTIVAAYNSDTLYSIKKRVIELSVDQITAEGEPVNPQFVMDWVCDERPTASRVALETAALELSSRLDDLISDFMEDFMVEPEADTLSMTEAQSKQRYAVRRHLLKLALPEVALSGEPLSVLLKRSESCTDGLEATQDLPEVQTLIQYYNTSENASESVLACFEADFAHMDTGSTDAFLDAAELDDVFADIEIGVASSVADNSYILIDSNTGITYTPSSQTETQRDEEEDFRDLIGPSFDITQYTKPEGRAKHEHRPV
nr:hypothetical protein [uncultured Pseudomonas sp.]